LTPCLTTFPLCNSTSSLCENLKYRVNAVATSGSSPGAGRAASSTGTMKKATTDRLIE